MATSVALAFGCQSVLGIDDTTLGNDDGDAATGGAGVGGSSGSSNGGSGGGSGDGGIETDAPSGDFTFVILSAEARVPLDGVERVFLRVTRTPGFEEPVQVAVQDAVTGLDFVPLEIPADESDAELQLSASPPLAIGNTFQITLRATSGELQHDDEVPATIIERPASLDETFGLAGSGVHEFDFEPDSSDVQDIQVFSDGRIAFTGHGFGNNPSSSVGIFVPNATAYDATFSATAKAIIDCVSPCTPLGYSQAISLLSDGHVNVLTKRYDDLLALQYKTNGAAEPLFGETANGFTRHDLGGTETANAMVAIQDQNGTRYVVAGVQGSKTFAIALSAGGYFAQPTLDLGGMNGATHATLALDQDQRSFVIGTIDEGDGKLDIQLAALDTDLVLDPSFDSDGLVQMGAAGVDDQLGAVQVQADGKIVVAGVAGGDVWLRRFTATGVLDASFGVGGVATLAVPSGQPSVVELVISPDSRLIAIGNVAGGSEPGPLLVRFRANGQPDPTFGNGGLELPALSVGAELTCASMQEGLLLVGGWSKNGIADRRALIARLWL